VDGIQLGL
jgi:hypothetical protein